MPIDPKDPRVQFVELKAEAGPWTADAGWLEEKSLAALEDLVRVIDLVNTTHPDSAGEPLRFELHPVLWNVLKLAAAHVARSRDAFSDEWHKRLMADGLSALEDWKKRWATRG